MGWGVKNGTKLLKNQTRCIVNVASVLNTGETGDIYIVSIFCIIKVIGF